MYAKNAISKHIAKRNQTKTILKSKQHKELDYVNSTKIALKEYEIAMKKDIKMHDPSRIRKDFYEFEKEIFKDLVDVSEDIKKRIEVLTNTVKDLQLMRKSINIHCDEELVPIFTKEQLEYIDVLESASKEKIKNFERLFVDSMEK